MNTAIVWLRVAQVRRSNRLMSLAKRRSYWAGNRVPFIENIADFGIDGEELLIRCYQSIARSEYGRWWLRRRIGSGLAPVYRTTYLSTIMRVEVSNGQKEAI